MNYNIMFVIKYYELTRMKKILAYEEDIEILTLEKKFSKGREKKNKQKTKKAFSSIYKISTTTNVAYKWHNLHGWCFY